MDNRLGGGGGKGAAECEVRRRADEELHTPPHPPVESERDGHGSGGQEATF